MSCRPFWKLHAWGRWMTTRRYQIETQPVYAGIKVGDPYLSGEEFVQERECQRCGMKQSRKVKA